MKIEDLTLGQLREIQALQLGGAEPAKPSYPSLIGKNVAVRTVTMIYTGRLATVTDTDLVLLECSWIAETERWAQFIAKGEVRECEPYPSDLMVFINRGALLDHCELRAPLPRTQK